MVAHDDLAAVRADDLPGDRQPQTRSARSALTAGIETNEALENPLPVGCRNPRAVVDHVEDGVRALPADPQLNTMRRVPGGVVSDVAQSSGEVVPVADDPDRR